MLNKRVFFLLWEGDVIYFPQIAQLKFLDRCLVLVRVIEIRTICMHARSLRAGPIEVNLKSSDPEGGQGPQSVGLVLENGLMENEPHKPPQGSLRHHLQV